LPFFAKTADGKGPAENISKELAVGGIRLTSSDLPDDCIKKRLPIVAALSYVQNVVTINIFLA